MKIKLNLYAAAALSVLTFSLNGTVRGMEQPTDQELKINNQQEFYEKRRELIDICIEQYKDLITGEATTAHVDAAIKKLSKYYIPLINFPKIDGVKDWKEEGGKEREVFLEMMQNPEDNQFARMNSNVKFYNPHLFANEDGSLGHGASLFQSDFNFFLCSLRQEINNNLSLYDAYTHQEHPKFQEWQKITNQNMQK